MPRKRVCVIGAGSSGLAAIHELKDDFDVVAFEARSHVGGAWTVYGSEQLDECVIDWDGSDGIGRARVRGSREGSDSRSPPAPTPMYASLRTNVPTTLMEYRGQRFPPSTNTFPSPKEIQQYLDDTASSVADLIRLNTRVSNLRYTVPQDGGHQRRWTITATPISSSQTASLSTDEQFDLVVAANGHYARPFVPHIEGANIFQGKVIHARWYRGPEAFQGKNVLVVGNAATGYDVTREIATSLWERREEGDSTATQFIAQSSRKESTSVLPFDRPDAPPYTKIIKLLPGISKMTEKEVHFVDGQVLADVDVIVFATGYLFSFPFADPSHAPFNTHPLTLPPTSGQASDEGGLRVHSIDSRQLFFLPDPTLCLLLLQFYVVPFPLAQIQARLFAAHHAGKVELAFAPFELEDGGGETRAVHALGYPADHDYADALLGEMGDGEDDWSKWCKMPQVHRDLRMGGKALRGAVLGY